MPTNKGNVEVIERYDTIRGQGPPKSVRRGDTVYERCGIGIACITEGSERYRVRVSELPPEIKSALYPPI